MKKSILSNAAFFVALVSILSGARAAGTSQDAPARVDALFSRWDTATPGCSVAVSREGAVILERGYGMANLEYGARITPATRFHVASISKQFTAAAIVLLAQEGRISLDDPVRKYVPELADFGEPITIRHLVHHVSGLRDQWAVLDASGWRYSQDLITDDDVMRVVSRQRKLNFPPGTRESYSNTGYTLLAQIVRRVSGKTLRQFTQERLFVPLGMTSTHFRDDFSAVEPQFAYGYSLDGAEARTSVTNFDTTGATSLITTAQDLLKWEENFHHARVGGRSFIEQMLEQGRLRDGKRISYAFGLVHGNHRGLRTVSHSGGDAGYAAHLLRFPDQRLSVAVLCNSSDAGPVELAEKVAEVYLESRMKPVAAAPDDSRPGPSHEEAADFTVKPELLPAYSGEYQSDEIEIPYEIGMRDGALVLDTLKRHAVPLRPKGPDIFEGDGYRLHFVKRPDGKVTGFELVGEDEAPYTFTRARVEPVVEQEGVTTGSFERVVAVEGRKEVPCPKQDARTVVLLVFGQSNSANWAQRSYRSAHGDAVLNHFDGRCYAAASPLLGANGRMGESWTLLGNELVDAGIADRVIIVATGIGGTEIARWRPGGDLNPLLVEAVEGARRRYSFTHLLWHQGESDAAAATGVGQYQSSFHALRDDLRRRGVQAPIFVSVASRGDVENWKARNPVADAQRALVDPARGIFAGVDTDLLMSDSDRYDCCHFAQSGQEKFADAWLRLLKLHASRPP